MVTKANPSEVSTPSASGSKSGVRMVLVIALAVVLGLLGGGGAAWMYALHGGHLPFSKRPGVPEKTAPKNETTRALVLDPFLINLADPDGSSYLRLSMTLRIVAADGNKKNAADGQSAEDTEKAALRDTALDILSRQTSDALLSPNGKDSLKKQLLEAFAARNREAGVREIYFTEMLIQK